MEIIVLFIVLFGTLLIGFPIGLAIVISVVSYVLIAGGIPFPILFQQMVGGANSFPLLAVPLFILAGNLMNSGGMTDRIFRFARALIGFIPGGLAHVNIMASIIFAGMSGAAVADVSGLGMIEVKAMREAGYDDAFSAAITAASSTLSPIIPPSIAAVIYAVMTDQSVGAMFLGGIIPGILMAAALMITVFIISIKRHFPRDSFPTATEIWESFKRSILGILTPCIILGGIYTGTFTPTESAVIADVYALIITVLVYKELEWRSIPKILVNTAEVSALIMFIICAASSFSWVVVHENLPRLAGELLSSIHAGPNGIMLIFIIIFLILGLFMETIANILIAVPILLPVAVNAGIDPIHFGIVMLVTLMIGLNTPPLGVCLYAVANVADTPVERIIRELIPFYLCLIISVILIAYFPQVTLWLPSLFN